MPEQLRVQYQVRKRKSTGFYFVWDCIEEKLKTKDLLLHRADEEATKLNTGITNA